MSTRTRYFCYNCKCETELVAQDHGGWEEFWGRKVWHPQFTDVCEKCGKEDWVELWNSDDVDLTEELADCLRK